MLHQRRQKYYPVPSRFPVYLSSVTHNSHHLFASIVLMTFASVTSVGGTTHIHEIAANLSGGGFSDYVRALGLMHTRISDIIMLLCSFLVLLTRMLPLKDTLTSSPRICTADFSIGDCSNRRMLV